MFTGKRLDSAEETLWRPDSAAGAKQAVCLLLDSFHSSHLTWAPSWSTLHERALGLYPVLQGGEGEAESPTDSPAMVS